MGVAKGLRKILEFHLRTIIFNHCRKPKGQIRGGVSPDAFLSKQLHFKSNTDPAAEPYENHTRRNKLNSSENIFLAPLLIVGL